MILESAGKNKTLIICLGHKHPEFMIDNQEAFGFFHNADDYVFTFVVDNDENTAEYLSEIYGEEFVYFTGTKNGWGRGCLRSIVAGIEYFEKYHNFNDLITFDADCICTGPFLTEFSNMCKRDKKVFFGGVNWGMPDNDHHMHYYFQKNVGVPFNLNSSVTKGVIAGPCMLWTESCLEFMRSHGWISLKRFDDFYDHIFWPHDQISAYMESYANCGIVRISRDMLRCEMSGKQVHYKSHEDFGRVPIISDARVLHPTGLGEGDHKHEENYELEKNNRAYFKEIRSQYAKKTITREDFVKQDKQAEDVIKGPPVVELHTKFIRSKKCEEKSCKTANKRFI